MRKSYWPRTQHKAADTQQGKVLQGQLQQQHVPPCVLINVFRGTCCYIYFILSLLSATCPLTIMSAPLWQWPLGSNAKPLDPDHTNLITVPPTLHCIYTHEFILTQDP